MDVLSNTVASSDDEEVVVCKRKSNQASFRRNRLADSDDDSPPQSPQVPQPTGTSDNVSSLPLNSRTADSIEHTKSDEDDDVSAPSDTNTHIGMSDDKDVETKENNTLRKRRVVREISISDDETEAPRFFEKTHSSTLKKSKEGMKKLVDSDSESDLDKEIKPSRFRRKDKVMEKIRKTFGKKRTENTIETNDIMKPLLSLCDKDSSSSASEDEQSQTNESILNIKHSYEKHKNVRKSKPIQNNKLKVVEAQHKRMSAKEAMENMTKIKSESSRMLREKRVMLPYHRPRQLSLQDILGRKRPILPEANHLSFKMNQAQLEQYALQLEESQKHMTELYKSDDEDDNLAEKEINDNNTIANNETDVNYKEIDQDNCGTTENLNKRNNCDSAKEISDKPLETANTTEGPVTDVRSMKIYQEASTVNVSLINSTDNCNLNKTMEEEIDSLPAIPISTDSPQKFVDSVPSEHNMNQDSQLIHLHFSENTEVDHQPNAEKDSGENNIHVRYSENKEGVNKNNIARAADVREANNSNSEIDDIAVNKVLIAATDTNVEKANSDYKTHHTVQMTTAGNKSADSNELDTSFGKDKDCTNEEISLRINTSEFSSNDEKDKSKEIAMEMTQHDSFDDDFPDDDIDAIMDEIDNGKESQIEDSPMLIKDVKWCKPQLSGAPGTVIDLDDPTPSQKKMSGVDLLKQRYMYFSNMKTPEEEERENEKKMKPGTKHLQLKHELERQIAEQSLAEWTKRLEEDRQQQEIRANGELSDCEDELEKMEKACDNSNNDVIKEDSIAEEANENKDKEQGDELGEDEEEEEEELDESEKRHNRRMKPNPMIDDEAEVDDDEEGGDDDEDTHDDNDGNEEASENYGQSVSSDEQDSSSEDEDTEERKPKKGRIFKAFEDSDDEDQQVENKTEVRSEETMEKDQVIAISTLSKQTSDLFESQTTEADEDIPLAQPTQSNSEDMNVSFSEEIRLVQPTTSKAPPVSEKLTVIFETQHNSEVDMEAIVGMCSGKFPSETPPEPPVPQSVSRLVGDLSTQVIGEDILQLCSGRFGEDVLTTQTVNNDDVADMFNTQSSRLISSEPSVADIEMNRAHRLFDELETNVPKINKFFGEHIIGHGPGPHDSRVGKDRKVLQKGKLVIESSDEEAEVKDGENNKKKMKRKKREKRTLLISDDEEEVSEREQSASDEDDMAEEGDKVFEYDSEENEVEVARVGAVRARAAHEFLEREAELSSEEEWAGSGDEDERGPDRLEREAGDDDVFHQGRLRRELGQMHMQDLMDQDKREVRMLQEILLEDGDLAGGSRQRKFRWKNTEGGVEAGTVPDEFGDTPEEERESEEQWRRQRHERQVFLRQLAEQQKPNDDILDVGFARSIVASSLRCKTTSSVETADEEEGKAREGAIEKKQSSKDFPSPVKNSFTIMQEQYRALVNGIGGGGSLRRLAALVEPGEKPIHNVSSLAPGKKRSFVFTTLTQPASEPLGDDNDPPVTQKKKRKAEMDIGTPKLIKKLRVEEKTADRRSIFHHLDT